MLIVTTDGIEGRKIADYLDYEVVGDSMLMVSANGTAVKLG